MKKEIKYVVKALYNEKENGTKRLHQKQFNSSNDVLKNRNSAKSHFNLVIELLEDCNLLEIEYRKNTILAASNIYHLKISSVTFVENHRKAQGIRFGFKVNETIAKHFDLDSKTFYELDFVDHFSKERNQKNDDNRTIERKILQTLYPTKITLLKKSESNFDMYHIIKLVKEQSILELQIVKNLEEIDLLFESVCAFLNSEKGGYILFKNDEPQQINAHEFENIIDILKTKIFHPYKKLIHHATIPSFYFYENPTYAEIRILRIKPNPDQNATYKANNFTNKFFRHRIFGNVECLD